MSMQRVLIQMDHFSVAVRLGSLEMARTAQMSTNVNKAVTTVMSTQHVLTLVDRSCVLVWLGSLEMARTAQTSMVA